jgi:nitrogen regulatory protein P-II 1
MKKIEAIVRNSKLEPVKNSLAELGVSGMTITEVLGTGKQKGGTITYRGIEAAVDSVPRIKLEVVVADDDVERVIDAIFQAAHTGEIGDGRILVVDLESVTRIRTGETEVREPSLVAHEGVSHFAQVRRY